MKSIALYIAVMLLAQTAPADTTITPVDLELSLLVDVSGSIDSSEFDLQRQGYADAFRHPEVLSAIQRGDHRSIAVNLVYWSSAHQQSAVVPFTLIKDAASAHAFADAIQAAPRSFNNSTAIGSAIQWATPTFSTNQFDGDRWVMDVSGDGTNNLGVSPSLARDAALGAGVTTINGLTIGHEDLKQYFAQNVVGDESSFTVSVAGFDDVRRAVRNKIFIETSNSGGEPRKPDCRPIERNSCRCRSVGISISMRPRPKSRISSASLPKI